MHLLLIKKMSGNIFTHDHLTPVFHNHVQHYKFKETEQKRLLFQILTYKIGMLHIDMEHNKEKC